MALTEIIDEIQALGTAVEEAQPGDARLSDLAARLARAKDHLAQAAATLGPLVPNAANPPSLEQETAADLGRRLASLSAVVEAKRTPPL